jgi:hypothetical protein
MSLIQDDLVEVPGPGGRALLQHGENQARAVVEVERTAAHAAHGRRRVLQGGIARNQVRALPTELGEHVVVEQRPADFDHAEGEDDEQRQQDRELDEALAALGGEPVTACGTGVQRHSSNLRSFFAEASTLRTTSPFGKNGRTSGV